MQSVVTTPLGIGSGQQSQCLITPDITTSSMLPDRSNWSSHRGTSELTSGAIDVVWLRDGAGGLGAGGSILLDPRKSCILRFDDRFIGQVSARVAANKSMEVSP